MQTVGLIHTLEQCLNRMQTVGLIHTLEQCLNRMQTVGLIHTLEQCLNSMQTVGLIHTLEQCLNRMIQDILSLKSHSAAPPARLVNHLTQPSTPDGIPPSPFEDMSIFPSRDPGRRGTGAWRKETPVRGVSVAEKRRNRARGGKLSTQLPMLR
ncbi:hypothetical protein AAFF_G00435400 [Aldrovandia affinis]|uniref:Uncharacterized protein n=1 Tax=Aldrovandia affinis TaxID=143900 RepID=A0AAD7SAN4_9TELE|nr:hypothetical protein AAFF_G00435400 [Aldrovandia affinis]